MWFQIAKRSKPKGTPCYMCIHRTALSSYTLSAVECFSSFLSRVQDSYYCRLIFSDPCNFQILTQIICDMFSRSLILLKRIKFVMSAFGVDKCEMICIGSRKLSELFVQSEGLQVDCHHSGWHLEINSSSIKLSALCLVVIKESISNLRKCYEKSKE